MLHPFHASTPAWPGWVLAQEIFRAWASPVLALHLVLLSSGQCRVIAPYQGWLGASIIIKIITAFFESMPQQPELHLLVGESCSVGVNKRDKLNFTFESDLFCAV